MNDQDTLIRRNRAFYTALSKRDYRALDDLWADGLPVSCIHAGWPPLFGRTEVMMGVRNRLKPSNAAIQARYETVNVTGDTALVLCEEVMGGKTVLAAANLFAREHGEWRLVHHQSGPSAARTAPQASLH